MVNLKSLRTPLLVVFILVLFGFALDAGFSAFIQLTALFILVNAILAMSLNLISGYTGQFSLGHAGFMAVGAYFSAYASQNFSLIAGPFAIFNFAIFSLGAGLLAAVFGFLVGQPSLRLKGDYLAIVTLGFGEIIRVALLNTEALGGARGLHAIPPIPEINLGFVTLNRFLSSFSFASAWLVICLFVIARTVKSSHGRAFMSVREDEIAAAAMGINTTQVKVRAFIISSFFAGVAGALYAHFTRYVGPSSFTFVKSVDIIIMVVFGGMGSLSGSISAAAFITILPELLRPLQELTGVDLRMVIYSALLILLMIVKPSGIFGELEITDLWRKYVRKSS